jgi:hypothetical protein
MSAGTGVGFDDDENDSPQSLHDEDRQLGYISDYTPANYPETVPFSRNSSREVFWQGANRQEGPCHQPI